MNKLIFLWLTMFLFSGSVSAGEIKAKKLPPRNKAQCDLISSREAMNRAQAKAKANGKIVSVKLVSKGSHSIYRVRMLVGEKRIKNLTIKACK